mgnify:CR=1 FL=1
MAVLEQVARFTDGPQQTDAFGLMPWQRRKVFSGAAKILTAADSGALCLWTTAAGYLFTLPAITVENIGMWFDFNVHTTITSVGAKVITSSGDFLVGSFIQSPDSTTLLAAHAANGTTHVSWNGDGTTTGGYSGDFFRVTSINGTQWLIFGLGLATGTEATPFATS